MARLDMRLAKGRQWDDLDGQPVTDGRSALWVRLPEEDDSRLEVSAGALAILGDYVPFGISQSQGFWWPSNSLDNTIRIVSLAKTDWVLVDVRVEGNRRRIRPWDRVPVVGVGRVVGAASQSALLRSSPH